MKNIGFIGVGIMGRPMVRNLMKAGYEVHIYARTRAKVEDVIADGAVFHEDMAGCVKGRDAVITIVGQPSDVEDVYFTEGKVLDSADKGTYLIDMSTTSPALEQRIFAEANARGYRFLDAPVTGGEVGAIAGTLSVLVGGREKDFGACRELFEAMGSTITYYGASGAGQHAKLANQILQASIMSGLSEAMAYAESKGLDMNLFMEGAKAGAGQNRLLEMYGPRIMAGDMAPGFFVDFFIKDMKLGYEDAASDGLELSSLKLTMDHYRELSEKGLGRDGMQSLIKYYRDDF